MKITVLKNEYFYLIIPLETAHFLKHTLTKESESQCSKAYSQPVHFHR